MTTGSSPSQGNSGTRSERTLVDLQASPERARELRQTISTLPSWDLTERQLCDLELLAVGAFSPLNGFMGQRDCEAVAATLRLADGRLWPIPVTLDVSAATAELAARAGALVLRDPEGFPLAVIQAIEIWQPDREIEAESVYGTLDRTHPGVASTLKDDGKPRIAGALEVLRLPTHFDFVDMRHSPRELRAEFARRGWRKVVAFQTRNPMHRAHFELTLRAAERVSGNLLIHPAVGATKPGDVDHFTRVRCYNHLLPHYPNGLALLSLLPLAMRMGGPREAVLHALIRANYGCTHLIVGRDHAGPGNGADGKPFYSPYAAQELVAQHEAEIGIETVRFEEMVYLAEDDRYLPDSEARALTPAKTILSISGTDLRKRLETGREIPSWFTFPEVGAELRRRHPARDRQGFTVFFTGLSGAGKSTAARALAMRLQEVASRSVTLLDGDLVRKNLSSELGFSKEHRDLNVRRIGYVASEITKAGGIALCAPIAPYDLTRKEVRAAIAAHGGFALVWISTPIETCEQRDAKGLYAKARAGLLPAFTGISDPYESPADADLTLDATSLTPEEMAQSIFLYLEREGYLGAATPERLS
ncbi:MAG: bifunctional sulfate adenylyltransferase/adenylylsulfate kinase [Thermoanaerobaculia bacterium]